MFRMSGVNGSILATGYKYEVRGFFDLGRHGFQTGISVVQSNGQPPEAKLWIFCHAKQVEEIIGRLGSVLVIEQELTQSETIAPGSSIQKVTVVFACSADTLDACKQEIDKIIEKTDWSLRLVR